MTNEPRQVIPVMHCFDNNYVIPAAASFYSMLKHANSVYEYKLYVLHNDITWQNQQKLIKLVEEFSNASLEFIDMLGKLDVLWHEKNIGGGTHITKEVLYKLLAPSIFTQYDKLIITDVDVIFEGDIAPSFFSFDTFDDIFLAGVKHLHPYNSFLDTFYLVDYPEKFEKDVSAELKICGGFLVLNLHRLRESKMENVFMEYLKKYGHKLLQAEQDVFNFTLQSKHIVNLPLNYIVCSYAYDLFSEEKDYSTDRYYSSEQIKDALLNPIQIHYATSKKPWNTTNCTKADKWFSVLKQTDFYQDYIKIELNKGNFITPKTIWPDYCEPSFPVMVSILCCTYNHIRFIKNTLEYIVKQETAYTFEVIIADDASTDGTQQIIMEYKEKYPHLFKKCILRDKNVGIGQNYYEALLLVEGKYLTICDGDDYWISPHKLQLQTEFMEKNPDTSIVCSSYIMHDIDSKIEDKRLHNINHYIQLSWSLQDSYGFKDLLYCRFIASCTLMIRWHLHGRIPQFIKNYFVIDFQLTLIHSAFGRITVMNEHVLAQYNSGKHGVLITNNHLMESETKKIIREVNQFLDFNFVAIINEYFIPIMPTRPIPVFENRRILKWVYTYWTAPFIQKILLEGRERGLPPNIFRKIRWFIWVVYNECTPEAFKWIYRKTLKPILVKIFRR